MKKPGFLDLNAYKLKAIAANNLGGIYLAGDGGIPADPKEAQKWYSRAREVGFEHTPAIGNLRSPAAL